MSHDKAIVRKQVERIDGVTKAWFEWIYDEGELLKVLVVEVSFDTDPNSLHFRQSVIDAIIDTAETAFEEETTMVVCHLPIVPPPKENPGRRTPMNPEKPYPSVWRGRRRGLPRWKTGSSSPTPGLHRVAEPALANLACDLDGDQRSLRFLLLSSPPDHAVRAICRPDYVIGLNPSALQETIMNQLIRAGAITVAIFSSVGIATAQRAPGTAQADLTPSQERMVSQGLASSPSQPAPTGAQPHVGNRIPDSMSAQALPNNVTDQVPDAKGLLFIKLPDRIVLIDPDTKLVTEILMGATTTGSSPASSSPPSR